MAIVPEVMFDVFLLLFGLLFGSFANVVIWRVPRGESIVSPPSHCPSCGHEIRWHDNIPVLSWLALRARCRDCAEPIPARYPLVEALSGGLWLAAAVSFGVSWRAVVAAAMFWFLLVLSAIDLDTYRLPNRLVAVLGCVGVAGAAASQLTGVSVSPLVGEVTFGSLGGPVLSAAIGLLLGGGLPAAIAGAYWLVRRRTGLGMGDVKLLAAIGLFTGLYVPMSLVLGSIVGAVVGIVGARRSGEDAATHRIPFGPFLAGGAVVTVLAGPVLWGWYAALLGLR